MFGCEALGRQMPFGEEFSERSVVHAAQRTLTRYTAQEGMYPIQVLDLSPMQGHPCGMANRLSHLRKKAGFTQESLAKALNTGRSTITKLERSEIPMTDRWLDRLSNVLKCAPADILGDYVPVVGKIGAGGTVIFEDIGSEDMVKRPADTPGEIVGLEVDGDSMLPKFDPGDIVYISRDHDGVDLSDVGAICACRLTTGETYLKQLVRGARPGTWTLRSYNASDMADVELEWATPIRSVTPRHARKYH